MSTSASNIEADADGRPPDYSQDEISENLISELNANFDNKPDTTPQSVFTTIIDSFAEHQDAVIEERIRSVYYSAFISTASGQALDNAVSDFGITRIPPSKATGVVTFFRDSVADQDYVIQTGTVVQTGGETPLQYVTTEAVTLSEGNASVRADIEAVDGGSEYNVSSNSIDTVVQMPRGISGVRNDHPIGDPSRTDTDGDTLVAGEQEESDEALRERAKRIITTGGDATVDAILGHLLDSSDLPGIENAILYNNRSEQDNANGRGLPGPSMEIIVYGGDTQSVAEALHNKVAATDRMVGGIHGTEVVEDVEGINGQMREITFTRPFKLDIELIVNVVVNDTYIGTEELKTRIIEEVGGEAPDGMTYRGTGIGEDIYIDQLVDEITGPDDTGVVGVSQLTSSPSVTTDSNGLDIIDVDQSEVGRINNDNLTINVSEA